MNEECFTHFLKFYENRQQKIYFTTSRITESQTIHCINILSVTSNIWIPVEQITINRKATKKKNSPLKKYPLLYLKRYVSIMRDMYKLKPILKLYKDKWRERIGEWISNILFLKMFTGMIKIWAENFQNFNFSFLASFRVFLIVNQNLSVHLTQSSI